MNQKTSQTPPVLVLVKAMNILSAFTFMESTHTLSSLSEKLNMPKSSVHRILCTLQAGGYVTCDPAGNYELGLVILESAAVVLHTMDYRDMAKPYLHQLAKDLGETIYLSSLSGSNIIYLDEIQGFQYVDLGTRIGTSTPVFYPAMGRVQLSQYSREQYDQIIADHPLTARTSKTIVDPDELWDKLCTISEQGYAFDGEEFETGICCVAAPIRNYLGSIIAAFGISAPSARLNEKTLQNFLPAILSASDAISSKLGYRK